MNSGKGAYVLSKVSCNYFFKKFPFLALMHSKYYLSAFGRPLSLLFHRSLSTCVFPEIWNLFYVIFKKGNRRNNLEDYRGVAILSAIPKRLVLLVCRTMYEDLENLISVNQHGFMKNRSPVTNLLD
jgi:hypothetical protein